MKEHHNDVHDNLLSASHLGDTTTTATTTTTVVLLTSLVFFALLQLRPGTPNIWDLGERDGAGNTVEENSVVRMC